MSVHVGRLLSFLRLGKSGGLVSVGPSHPPTAEEREDVFRDVRVGCSVAFPSTVDTEHWCLKCSNFLVCRRHRDGIFCGGSDYDDGSGSVSKKGGSS
jgi:hypothetical protein